MSAPAPARPAMGVQNQLLLLCAAASFGASPLLLTISVQQIPPVQLAALRAALGLPLIAAVALLWGQLRWPGGDSAPPSFGQRAPGTLGASLLTAFGGGVLVIAIPFATMAAGMQYIPSGLGGILYSTMPLFTLLLAAAFLRDEPVTRAQAGRIALGLGGVVLIAGPPLVVDGLAGAGWGTLLVLASPLSYAAGNVWLRRRAAIAPLALSTGMFAGGALVLVPAALLFEGAPQVTIDAPLAVTLAALVGLATVLPAVLNYVLVRRVGANAASLAMFLLPVFAVLYGMVFMGERLPLLALAGMTLVIAASFRRRI